MAYEPVPSPGNVDGCPETNPQNTYTTSDISDEDSETISLLCEDQEQSDLNEFEDNISDSSNNLISDINSLKHNDNINDKTDESSKDEIAIFETSFKKQNKLTYNDLRVSSDIDVKENNMSSSVKFGNIPKVDSREPLLDKTSFNKTNFYLNNDITKTNILKSYEKTSNTTSNNCVKFALNENLMEEETTNKQKEKDQIPSESKTEVDNSMDSNKIKRYKEAVFKVSEKNGSHFLTLETKNDNSLENEIKIENSETSNETFNTKSLHENKAQTHDSDLNKHKDCITEDTTNIFTSANINPHSNETKSISHLINYFHIPTSINQQIIPQNGT